MTADLELPRESQERIEIEVEVESLPSGAITDFPVRIALARPDQGSNDIPAADWHTAQWDTGASSTLRGVCYLLVGPDQVTLERHRLWAWVAVDATSVTDSHPVMGPFEVDTV